VIELFLWYFFSLFLYFDALSTPNVCAKLGNLVVVASA
jgi:hypothetical protein